MQVQYTAVPLGSKLANAVDEAKAVLYRVYANLMAQALDAKETTKRGFFRFRNARVVGSSPISARSSACARSNPSADGQDVPRVAVHDGVEHFHPHPGHTVVLKTRWSDFRLAAVPNDQDSS